MNADDPADPARVRQAAHVVRAIHACADDPKLLPGAHAIRAVAWDLRLDTPDALRTKDYKRLRVKREYAQALFRAFPTRDAVDRLATGIDLLFAGVPPRLVGAAVRKWERDATDRVTKDPYGAMYELLSAGATLDDADRLAKTPAQRVVGLARWMLMRAKREGDTCVLTTRVLDEAVRRRLVDVEEKAREALADAVQHDVLRLVGRPDAQECMTDAETHALESEIAVQVVRRATAPQNVTADTAGPDDLTPDQVAAVDMVLNHGFSVLTGGPGTGKTTVVRALVDILGAERCMLTAPTGRAARHVGGSTVHSASGGRLLRRRPLQETTRADVPDDLVLMVVDEASMLTAELMMSVLHLAPTGCRVLLVGDPDQLPPVGAGNVLVDLLNSGRIPVTKLTYNHRSVTGVQVLAAAVLDTSVSIPTHFPGGFVDPDDPLGFAVKATTTREDVQILTPRNATRLLFNRAVQMAKHGRGGVPVVYHDGKGLAPRGARVSVCENGGGGGARVAFDDGRVMDLSVESAVKRTRPFHGLKETLLPGDLVMVLKNQNKKRLADGQVSACNGDVGVYEPQEHRVAVRFKTGVSVFPSVDDWLTLAYAATVHKFQGSECDEVVLPVSDQTDAWDRSLLYTAVTRARHKVWIIGTEEDVERIRGRHRPRRLTVLSRLFSP